MIYYNRIVIILLIALCMGCQVQSSDEHEPGTSYFLLVKEITESEEFQNTLLDYGIDLFHSKVIAHEGQLIISSRGGRLLSVSMDGNVNWALEQPGNGPGEFYDPHDMQIADGLIGVLNIDRAKINLFTIEGEHYRDIQLQGSAYQFGMAAGEVHIFYPYDTDYLFTAYDIETGKERRYGQKELLEVLPDKVIPENFMHYSNLLRTDSRYTLAGLVHYAQILIYDRQEGRSILMDLSDEKEIAESIRQHSEEERKMPPGSIVTHHILDIVNIGDYFGVTVPGTPDVERALMYRIIPEGVIHDKIYRKSNKRSVTGMRIAGMDNLTLLEDGTYFGHMRSQDRLLIVSILEDGGLNE